MRFIDTFAFIAFSILIVYMVMGIGAYFNQVDNEADVKRYDRSWVLSPTWCFYPDAYNEEGKTLCKRARILFYMGNGITLFWIVLDMIFY